jgi:hypothetical protein
MRCLVSNPRTLRRLSARLGRPVVKALTRGNTGHRVDCLADDGTGWSIWPNGQTRRDPAMDRRKDQ